MTAAVVATPASAASFNLSPSVSASSYADACSSRFHQVEALPATAGVILIARERAAAPPVEGRRRRYARLNQLQVRVHIPRAGAPLASVTGDPGRRAPLNAGPDLPLVRVAVRAQGPYQP